MIAIVLAGGYAKRLWPLTKEIAKPLLPVGEKRVIDYIMEKLTKLDDVHKIIVSTNLKFRKDFEKWAEQYADVNLQLVYDKSYREEEKPGAIKALLDITSGLNDDCLVIAGDNIFTDDLKDMIKLYHEREATVMGLYDVQDIELAKNYGVVIVDKDLKIISMEEKPQKPKSTLISTGIYIFPKGILPKLREYIECGRNPDEPGRFMKWLLESEPVYGYVLSGEWYDIGTRETYRRALECFGYSGEKDKSFLSLKDLR